MSLSIASETRSVSSESAEAELEAALDILRSMLEEDARSEQVDVFEPIFSSGRPDRSGRSGRAAKNVFRLEDDPPEFTAADAARAIAAKIDPTNKNMDPALAAQLSGMYKSPVYLGATPPSSPHGPVWFQSFHHQPNGDPNRPDAQIYAYVRDGELVTFEVVGAFSKAYETIDPSGGGTNSGLGLPTSGRERLVPGPGYFQNFENGKLVEADPAFPGGKSKFTWYDNQGNIVVENFEVVEPPPPDWAEWVRTELGPQLRAAGATDALIERVIRWGRSEGIYNIANNRSYGQSDGTRQSPLTFTNFFDSHRHPEWTQDTNVNALTSAPNPWDWVSSFDSGDWQVGIAGIQVSDAIPGALKRAFGALYPNESPAEVGRRILELMGEPGATFPDLTLDQLCERKNAKWAAVLLHDPALNILIQTWNPRLP